MRTTRLLQGLVVGLFLALVLARAATWMPGLPARTARRVQADEVGQAAVAEAWAALAARVAQPGDAARAALVRAGFEPQPPAADDLDLDAEAEAEAPEAFRPVARLPLEAPAAAAAAGRLGLVLRDGVAVVGVEVERPLGPFPGAYLGRAQVNATILEGADILRRSVVEQSFRVVRVRPPPGVDRGFLCERAGAFLDPDHPDTLEAARSDLGEVIRARRRALDLRSEAAAEVVVLHRHLAQLLRGVRHLAPGLEVPAAPADPASWLGAAPDPVKVPSLPTRPRAAPGAGVVDLSVSQRLVGRLALLREPLEEATARRQHAEANWAAARERATLVDDWVTLPRGDAVRAHLRAGLIGARQAALELGAAIADEVSRHAQIARVYEDAMADLGILDAGDRGAEVPRPEAWIAQGERVEVEAALQRLRGGGRGVLVVEPPPGVPVRIAGRYRGRQALLVLGDAVVDALAPADPAHDTLTLQVEGALELRGPARAALLARGELVMRRGASVTGSLVLRRASAATRLTGLVQLDPDRIGDEQLVGYEVLLDE